MTRIVLVISFCFAFVASYAQAPLAAAPMTPEDSALMIKRKKYLNLKNGMQLNLNESGSHFIKLTFLAQPWVRYNQNNPGTTVNGQKSTPSDGTFDIGMRRYRLQLYGKITDRIFFYSQMGDNSTSFLSERKFGFFLHDAVVEYAIKPGRVNGMLNIGTGLTGWTGYGRFSSPAVASIMGTDAPIFQQYANDQNDQFVRKYSVYAHGTIGRFHYRVALSKPFIVNSTTNAPANISGGQTPVALPGATTINGVNTDIASYSTRDPAPQVQGYFVYQFLDKEDFLVAYNPGTYHGSKKIFSVGAGFVYQNNAFAMYKNSADFAKGTSALTYQSMRLFAADIFYDAPVNKTRGDAISLYGGYFNAYYGDNYVRMFNVMNPADATNTGVKGFNSGGGNAFPMYGTGSMVYAQAGYMFKKDLFGEEFGTLMPYVSIQNNWLQALGYSNPSAVFDIGINWLIKGHNAKVSFDYQNRPFFQENATNTGMVQNGRYGSYILQYQISF